MPQPMPFHGDAPPTQSRHEDRPGPAPRSPDEDSSGRALALRLPDWDLLPPTEFLQRHQRN